MICQKSRISSSCHLYFEQSTSVQINLKLFVLLLHFITAANRPQAALLLAQALNLYQENLTVAEESHPGLHT